MSGSTATHPSPLTVECTLVLRPEYEGMHAKCRQIKDIPLPHSAGILLLARCRCRCTCHERAEGPS